MAIDPRIALAGQPVDIRTAIAGGLDIGENIRTADVRDTILRQQAQHQGLALKDQRQSLALESMRRLNGVVEGLTGIPDVAQRAKILAQQIPSFVELGIPESKLSAIDVSDEGLRNIRSSLAPFIARQERQQPAALETFDRFNAILQDPNATEDEKRAARIALKLDAPARSFAPKLVEIGGIKYMQEGTQLYNPQTFAPIPTDAQGMPIQPLEQQAEPQPQQLTPQSQIESEAERAAAITTAQEQAKLVAAAEGPEAQEERATELAEAQKTIQVIDSILSSDRLNNITGVGAHSPMRMPRTSDLLGTVQQLSSLLTAGNLGRMTGVLSESDMKIIAGLASDINLIKNDDGDVTGIRGSYDGTIKKLNQIRQEFVSRANNNGFFFDGQTMTNPETGERIVYRDGAWVPL